MRKSLEYHNIPNISSTVWIVPGVLHKSFEVEWCNQGGAAANLP